jgi:hypothetical protein
VTASTPGSHLIPWWRRRFFYSRATTVIHNPHIDIIHHLALFHNPSPSRKPPAAGKSPTKLIGAKHRQAHRSDLPGGRAPHVVSVGMNAGVAIRGDPLVGRSLQGYLGPGQIRESPWVHYNGAR